MNESFLLPVIHYQLLASGCNVNSRTGSVIGLGNEIVCIVKNEGQRSMKL